MIIPLGGGGSKVVASIVVTYPAGSTLTCTLGSKVLTAKDTSGKWVFGLPTTGNWVVKAVSGSKSTSKTVSITAEGQSESVELVYKFVLYDNGIMQNGGVVKSIDHESTYGSNSAVVNDGFLYISVANNLTLANGFRSVNAISGGKYSTLKVRVSNVSGNAYLRLAAKKTSDPYSYAGEDSSDEYAVLNKTSFTDGEYALDISAVKESAYYGAWIWGKNGDHTEGSCHILRLWLE